MRALSWSREAPLVAGVAVGWAVLWVWGGAFVLDGAARGYGWHDYLNHAWMVIHHTDVGYDYFRNPLHAWLLGAVGEGLGSYSDAGILLSSMAIASMVFASGLLARALAGPWAGGVAAMSVPLVRLSLIGTHHANSYPLLGAATGLALALGAALARWPRWGLALGAGIAAGLAIAVDGRGVFVVPGVLAFLAMGGLRSRRWGLVLGAVLPMLLLPTLNRPLWPAPDRVFSWAHKLDVQRQVVVRWNRTDHNEQLERDCRDFGVEQALRWDSLAQPCARAMARTNWRERIPSHLPYGRLVTVLAVPLLLLPGRRGVPGVVSGAVLVAGGLGPLLLLSALTLLPDRYFFQDTVAISVVVPVGLARLATTLLPGRWGRRAAAWGVLLAGGLVWRLDPAHRGQVSALERNVVHAQRTSALTLTRARLGRGDLFLDCSGLFVATALLPRITTPSPPLLKPYLAAPCLEWIDEAPSTQGEVWIGVDVLNLLHARSGDPGGSVDLVSVLSANPHWRAVASSGHYQLWRWEDE